jgi:Endosomal/lysosomal potassium channel TMEM175
VDDTNLISGLSKTRIEALTDGIFAIAMTLMVFDIKVPAVTQMNQLNLRHELIQLWPRFLAYVISFVMLGVYWVGHQSVSLYSAHRPTVSLDQYLLLNGCLLDPIFDWLVGSMSRGSHRIGSLWLESDHGRRISLRSLVVRHARKPTRPETDIFGSGQAGQISNRDRSGRIDLGNLCFLPEHTTKPNDLCFDSAPVPHSRAN